MNVMDRWVAAACAELGLNPAEAETGVVLDLARDVAHNVLRPGAPVTAYLLGLAVGRGAVPDDAVARLTALALNWPEADAPPGPAAPPDSPAQPTAGDAPSRGSTLPGTASVPVMPPAGAAEGTAG